MNNFWTLHERVGDSFIVEPAFRVYYPRVTFLVYVVCVRNHSLRAILGGLVCFLLRRFVKGIFSMRTTAVFFKSYILAVIVFATAFGFVFKPGFQGPTTAPSGEICGAAPASSAATVRAGAGAAFDRDRDGSTPSSPSVTCQEPSSEVQTLARFPVPPPPTCRLPREHGHPW